jgi:cation transport regulator ChaB
LNDTDQGTAVQYPVNITFPQYNPPQTWVDEYGGHYHNDNDFDYSYEKCFAVYNSNDELPAAVKNSLPSAAQTVWRKAYNAAIEENYDEKTRAQVAWSAVKKAGWKKEGEKWVKSEIEDENAKKPSEIENKSPPKGYPTSKSQYADPERYKYPLDTEKHVRAALSYWSKPANRKGYSAEEKRKIWNRILRACKKYNIEVSKDTKEKASVELNASDESEDVSVEWVVAGTFLKEGDKRIVRAVPFGEVPENEPNHNGWNLNGETKLSMLEGSVGKDVYWSHTDDPMCRDEPIGKVTNVLSTDGGDSIEFEITDAESINKIDSGQWDDIGVSIGAKAPIDRLLCSECGRPYYECDEHPDAYKVVAGGYVDHWAVVRNPAFDGANIQTDFFSSINAALEELGGAAGRGLAKSDPKPGNNEGPGGKCVCPECGKTVKKEAGIPCTDVECPSCGVKMKREGVQAESEDEYIELDPTSDLIIQMKTAEQKERENMNEKEKAETINSASLEDLKTNPEFEKIVSERDELTEKVKELTEKVEAYDKAEREELIAEIKKFDEEANDEELSAMDKDSLSKVLKTVKRVSEKLRAETGGSSPEQRPNVADDDDNDAPSAEEIGKAYAQKKFGLDVDSFLESIGKEHGK